jgi:succinoglycan biosynthesis transport protein ExoP
MHRHRMSNPAEAPPLQLSDLVAMVRRHPLAATLAAALAALAVFALPSLVMPSLYRAEATLTMGRGLKPVSFQSDPVAGLVPEQMVNTQRELLTSKAVLDDALAMGGLLANPAYARAADPSSLLQKRLRTSVVKNSWVINVSLDDEDPMRAEAGLQSVLDAYLAQQATALRTRSAEDMAFINTQLSEAKRTLEAAREAERLYREQHAIASVDPDRNHITARIQTLAERQAVLDERVAASGALLRQVQAADSIEDRPSRLAAYLRIDTLSNLTVVGSLQQDLFKLQGAEAELAARYLDKHPKLLEVRSHIAAKRAQLEETILAARTSVTADNQVLVEQRAALVRAQEELQRDLNLYRERLMELQRLILTSQAQQKVHDELLARQAQLTALAGYDDRRMTIDGRPRSSPVPRGVGTLPLAMLAAIAAAAVAIIAASLADQIDRTIRDAAQARSVTGLRLLTHIPVVDGLQPLCATGPSDPSDIAESMLQLRTALRYALGTTEGCRILLVASAAVGDGRSTVAARLAAACAMSGTRTLLVDGDLRQPTLAAQCGVPRPGGLAQLLAGEPDLAPATTAIPNLDLMPAGSPPANPGELLNSHCLGEWLGHCRAHYDLVLIDSPALLSYADALTLGEQVDGAVLVVRTLRTGRGDLLDAWNRLEPLRSRFLGLALVESA